MAPRVLIIRLSALGDILHALPLLDALKRQWPDAFIGWLTEPAGAGLLDGHPLIDRLHVVPRREWKANRWRALRGPLRALARDLRSQHYDTAIDAQGLTKSALWGLAARAPRRIGFAGRESRELAGLLNNERVLPAPDRLHVVERNLALLQPLGIQVRSNEIHFPVHIPAAARTRADCILGEDEAIPLIVMNPGAGWATKIWPPECYGQLARRLLEERPFRIALAWGPGEEPLVRAALAAAQAPPADFTLDTLPAGPGLSPLPATEFPELAAVIERATLFVGGDTGPTHLAAALAKPTVAMMGPLDARRNGPYGPGSVTIQHAVPRRAPWWANHRKWCDPRTDLRRVTVDEVLAACRAMLDRYTGPTAGASP